MRKPAHIPALDGLRGLAILLVFLAHFGGGAQSSILPVRIFGELAKAGWVGVPLFFVLSGYLITGILWDSFHHSHWWKNFYIRRSLRIFPLYFLALSVAILSALFFGDIRQCLSRIWIYALYGQNLPFFYNYMRNLNNPIRLGAFWSLAVEEQFYLCWPFLLSFTRSLKQAKTLCVSLVVLSFLYRIIATLPGMEGLHLDTATFSRGGELLIGAWLALKLREGPSGWAAMMRLVPAISLLSLGGFVALYARYGVNDIVLAYGVPLIDLFFGGLIAMAITSSFGIQIVFSVAPLRRLGVISYSLYVWHILLWPVCGAIALALASRANRNIQLGVRLVVASVLCVAVAELSYHYFEMPFLRLKEKFQVNTGTFTRETRMAADEVKS